MTEIGRTTYCGKLGDITDITPSQMRVRDLKNQLKGPCNCGYFCLLGVLLYPLILLVSILAFIAKSCLSGCQMPKPVIEDNDDHRVYTIDTVTQGQHGATSTTHTVIKLYLDGTCYIDVDGESGLGLVCGDDHTGELQNLPISFIVLEPFTVHSVEEAQPRVTSMAALSMARVAIQERQVQQSQPR